MLITVWGGSGSNKCDWETEGCNNCDGGNGCINCHREGKAAVVTIREFKLPVRPHLRWRCRTRSSVKEDKLLQVNAKWPAGHRRVPNYNVKTVDLGPGERNCGYTSNPVISSVLQPDTKTLGKNVWETNEKRKTKAVFSRRCLGPGRSSCLKVTIGRGRGKNWDGGEFAIVVMGGRGCNNCGRGGRGCNCGWGGRGCNK